MAPLPRDKALDSTIAVLSEGYDFIGNRCGRHGADTFETRIMLRKAVCMQGAEAARAFYTPGRFTRRGGMPKPALALLQDEGSAAVLDDDAHRHRKQMFLGLMTPASLDRLAEHAAREWPLYIGRWERAGEVVLHDEAQEILCRAACAWAGVPLAEGEVSDRTRDLGALIEGAGGFGPRHVRGHLARRRAERWAQETIEAARSGRLAGGEESPTRVIASHRELNGDLLTSDVAAVELLNLLRPTVAVARYVTFAALALHQHPEWRERLQAGGEETAEQFVQEVRRFYPFFPFVGGRARTAFEWRGATIPARRWVLLDLYGTNHDPRAWHRPEAFNPDRFEGWRGDPYTLIPQGGGDHLTEHRCAGEWATVRLMHVALAALTQWMDYEVPSQDLTVSRSRMPTLPKSGFKMRSVRPRGG